MKNVFMRRVASVMGIIVLTAVMILGMISCGETEEPLSGNVRILKPLKGDYYEGDVLEAVYDGTEAVLFEWYKGTATTATGQSTVAGKEGKFPSAGAGLTVGDSGTWKVKVVADDKTAESMSVTITVKAASEKPGYLNFLGYWVMIGSEQNPPYSADPTTSTATGALKSGEITDEKLFITADNLRIDSTFAGQPVETAYSPDSGNDMSAAFEYLDMPLGNWTSYTSSLPSGYSVGYQIENDSTKTTKYKGYMPYTTQKLVLAGSGTGDAMLLRRNLAGSGNFNTERTFRRPKTSERE